MERLLTLKSFGALLGGVSIGEVEAGEAESQGTGVDDDSAESPEVKKLQSLLRAAAVLEDATVPVLALEDTSEIAQLLVILAFLAGQPKHKDALSSILATHPGGPARNAALKAFESALEYQELDWKKNGDPKLSGKPPAPVLKLRASKVAELFMKAPETLKNLGPVIASEPVSHFDALAQTCLNRYTHSVKLSGVSGSGGFHRKVYPAHSDNEGSLCESDYRTHDRLSFETTAQYAAWRVMTLCQVRFNGELVNLPDLVSRPEIHKAVLAHLEESAHTNIRGNSLTFAAMLEALSLAQVQEPFNESQVFVGTVESPIVLSVLSSVALPAEIRHAHTTLAIAHKEHCAKEAVSALEKEAQLKQQLKAAKTEARKALPDHPVHEEVLNLTEELKAQEDAIGNLKSGLLFFPTVMLPIGGAHPRNVGAGLETNLHTSNLFSNITTARPRHALSSKVFASSSLVKPVELEEKRLQWFFGATAVDYGHKVLRKQRFADVCLSVLEPLISLQQQYRSLEVDTATTLTSDAVAVITESDSPWALFVKGDSKLNSSEKTEKLKDLERDVAAAVKQSFTNAYGKKFSNSFDAEIFETVADVIFKARA